MLLKSAFLCENSVFNMPTLKTDVMRDFILKYKENHQLRGKKSSGCRLWAFIGNVWSGIDENVGSSVSNLKRFRGKLG